LTASHVAWLKLANVGREKERRGSGAMGLMMEGSVVCCGYAMNVHIHYLTI